MERNAQSGFNAQITEEACERFVEFRGGCADAAQRRELDDWLRKSPEHLRAYLQIAAIWSDGTSLDPTGKWDDETLRREAETDVDNVVAHPQQARVLQDRVSARIEPELKRTIDPRTSSARRAVSTRFALAASLLVAAGGAWLYTQRNVYSTDIGEQRSIKLSDGSTVDLNSRSKVEIRYSARERTIELLQGQALFQVAKSASRPFVVQSGATRVRAVGTQFDVNRLKSGTIVTVLEGRVAVTTATGRASISTAAALSDRRSDIPMYLSAGQQLKLTGLSRTAPTAANAGTAVAWRQRQLVFESATLAEVAEEFNRYNERQLVIDDAALFGFHISGVFSTADPQDLLDFLRAQPGVEVKPTHSGFQVEKNMHRAGN